MQKIVFFDGVCNICNRSVNFVIKQDSKRILKFASLQSDYAKNMLPPELLKHETFDSMIFSDGKNFYTKSTAVLEICKALGGVFHVLRIGYLIPRFIRDAIYIFIANNRYRWFGKKDHCMVPTPELKERFLGRRY